MSVLIINTTQNERKFENQFCDILKNNINVESKVENLRELDLLNLKISGYEVVVVVSHGTSYDGLDNTYIGLGFNEEELGLKHGTLNNPTILSQMLGDNDRKFILIYCACSGLSAETLLSGIEIKNCIGVIASRTPIGNMYVDVVSDVINKVSDFMMEGSNDILSLDKDIKLIIDKKKGEPHFDMYCPHFHLDKPLTIVEENEEDEVYKFIKEK